MKEKAFFEDFEVGERVTTPGRTITETDLVMFSAFSGDWHPLHTDIEYAAGTMFKERIAHGLLGLVAGSALAFRLGPHAVLPKSFVAFYGMDKVRFTAPIKIHDTIHLEVEVTGLDKKGNNLGVVVAKNEIKNQKGEVCIRFESRILCGCRPSDSAG